MCAFASSQCAENKKKHQRNSCNKNQSERRERRRRAGRRAGGPRIPTRAILHLSTLLPPYAIYSAIFTLHAGSLPKQSKLSLKLPSRRRILAATRSRIVITFADPETVRRAAALGRFRAKRRLFLFLRLGEKNPALHLLNMRHATTQTRPGVCRIHFHLRHPVVSRRSRAAAREPRRTASGGPR